MARYEFLAGSHRSHDKGLDRPVRHAWTNSVASIPVAVYTVKAGCLQFRHFSLCGGHDGMIRSPL